MIATLNDNGKTCSTHNVTLIFSLTCVFEKKYCRRMKVLYLKFIT